jgi:hypothetical protein
MDLVGKTRKGICFEEDKMAKVNHIFNVCQYADTGFFYGATLEKGEKAARDSA